MHLFNAKISAQDLFGGDTHLLFNLENVYYRSAKQKSLSNYSRILWYISRGSNKFCDTMNISTSSYLFEIDIEKPKILFSKNKRLGIYQWQDLIKTANGDQENSIMAFNFGLNENFKSPINRKQLEPIFEKYFNKPFFAPQSPLRISEDMYFDIYSNGIKDLL